MISEDYESSRVWSMMASKPIFNKPLISNGNAWDTCYWGGWLILKSTAWTIAAMTHLRAPVTPKMKIEIYHNSIAAFDECADLNFKVGTHDSNTFWAKLNWHLSQYSDLNSDWDKNPKGLVEYFFTGQ